MAALLHLYLNVVCMQSKSSVYSNHRGRPTTDSLTCRLAVKLLIRSLDSGSCTGHEYATWRLLPSNYCHNTLIQLPPFGTHASAAPSTLSFSAGVELADTLSLGPSSRTPLATCLLDARASMTHCYSHYGLRPAGMVTIFTATPRLCYIRLRKIHRLSALCYAFQMSLKVRAFQPPGWWDLASPCIGMECNISACFLDCQPVRTRYAMGSTAFTCGDEMVASLH
jgi:hypothetical protein